MSKTTRIKDAPEKGAWKVTYRIRCDSAEVKPITESSVEKIKDALIDNILPDYKLSAVPVITYKVIYPEDTEDIESDYFWTEPENFTSDMEIVGLRITLQVTATYRDYDAASDAINDMETHGLTRNNVMDFNWTLLSAEKKPAKKRESEIHDSFFPFFRKAACTVSDSVDEKEINFIWTARLAIPRQESLDAVPDFIHMTDDLVGEYVNLDEVTEDIRIELGLPDLEIITITEIDSPIRYSEHTDIWDEGHWIFKSSAPINETTLWTALKEALVTEPIDFELNGYEGTFQLRV